MSGIITHLFVSHANLQLHLIRAVVRDLGVTPDRVMVLQVRGSYGKGLDLPFETLDGDAYQRSTGINLVRHYRNNREIVARFRREVKSRLADKYTIFSPMYTYWYLNDLKLGAEAYHLLEDGFGSMRTLKEMEAIWPTAKKGAESKRLRERLKRTGLLAAQRTVAATRENLLTNAAGAWSSSSFSFPDLPQQRRHLVKNIFPPEATGKYDGRVLLCLSCPVESGNMTLPEYADLLRYILKRLADRGVSEIVTKYHPRQLAAGNAEAYRVVLSECSQVSVVEEIDSASSIEGIAAGNNITLVTGYGTLALSVAQAGKIVWSYMDEMRERSAKIRNFLPPSVTDTVRKISEPL